MTSIHGDVPRKSCGPWLDASQLLLLFGQPGQQPRPVGGHKGRSMPPPDIPRDTLVYQVPEAPRTCTNGGNQKKPIRPASSSHGPRPHYSSREVLRATRGLDRR